MLVHKVSHVFEVDADQPMKQALSKHLSVPGTDLADTRNDPGIQVFLLKRRHGCLERSFIDHRPMPD
ncbi:MAG: hypothetical protein VYD52_01300 [Pseudomonadota bacterium]|nr:hypothetical protein [Pseudomonadota bacterium]